MGVRVWVHPVLPKFVRLRAERENVHDAASEGSARRSSDVFCKEQLFHRSATQHAFLSKLSACAACNETELGLIVLSQNGGPHARRNRNMTQQALRAKPLGGVVAWSGGVVENLASFDYATTTSTPQLVAAVRTGDVPLARALLRRGANVDSVDEKGLSALHAARMLGSSSARRARVSEGVCAVDLGRLCATNRQSSRYCFCA
jgi:hypothetical protein